MAATLGFAIVREDPRIELTVAAHVHARHALLVASGGCTAFAFTAHRPQTQLTLYDLNPAQLAHVEARRVADDPPPHLESGRFERLFHVFATGFETLIGDPACFFSGERGPDWFHDPTWPALFESTFHDRMLVALFGQAAVQHAVPGSYPAYFQRVIEAGLVHARARENPFLQHIFLGNAELGGRSPDTPFDTVLGGLPDVPDLQRFDLVHLSNIFDWCDDATIAQWCERLQALRPGSALTLRQLNNQRTVPLTGFTWIELDLPYDRSLFYERTLVGIRQ